MPDVFFLYFTFTCSSIFQTQDRYIIVTTSHSPDLFTNEAGNCRSNLNQPSRLQFLLHWCCNIVINCIGHSIVRPSNQEKRPFLFIERIKIENNQPERFKHVTNKLLPPLAQFFFTLNHDFIKENLQWPK